MQVESQQQQQQQKQQRYSGSDLTAHNNSNHDYVMFI